MFYTKYHHWILTQEISLKHTVCAIRIHIIDTMLATEHKMSQACPLELKTQFLGLCLSNTTEKFKHQHSNNCRNNYIALPIVSIIWEEWVGEGGKYVKARVSESNCEARTMTSGRQKSTVT